ncbi:Gfo/Idh/MocA family oxidoreductase [candidate division KSB1 bacterium]|nr:Gfo/Idh/MocA family oxidoreductase [candidate division KSB1 bacterium]
MKKIGIVGVGKLGNYHCNALTQIPEAELTGILDTDKNRAAEIAQKYNCQNFTNLEHMLDAVDVVGVIVPTTSHLDVAKPALERGMPVFVEKPIAGTVEQAREMLEIADRHNAVIQVGHIERFNPAIRALEDTELGPKFIESHRLSPFDPRGTDVAVVLDLMIHDIDIILSLVKSKVSQIQANGVAVVSDAVDIASARIQFENGCVANVTASRISQRKMRKMRLFQKDSYISIDFLQKLTEVFQLVDGTTNEQNTLILGQIDKGAKKRNIIYNKLDLPEDDAMQAEWKSFFHALQTGQPPVVSGEDGLKALEVANEITKKSQDRV